jgi:hypothetical protein
MTFLLHLEAASLVILIKTAVVEVSVEKEFPDNCSF